MTSATTSGKTNVPTATGRGDRTIRYSPIAAKIHDSTSSDSNGVVIGSCRALTARLARYNVCTTHPSPVSPTVRYHRAAPRTANRASSPASASA